MLDMPVIPGLNNNIEIVSTKHMRHGGQTHMDSPLL